MSRSSFLILEFLGAVISAVFFVHLYNVFPQTDIYYSKPDLDFWSFRSVDTMKYSRDLSREKMEDPGFDAVIDDQIKNIAAIGATHVAIATPYDEEFIPMLRRWVSAARKYKLNVWFRGNFSGWEGWFDYPTIRREEHKIKAKEFIISHPDIFEDGDVFSSCPECENGGLGDPRSTGDVKGFRKFIISEFEYVKSAFKSIGKKVQGNYYSMNADVAKLIMDKETTVALDGIVTIDHYVGTPEELAQDIEDISKESGGHVVLGEFGAPIPDIHGDMSEVEQADWINKALWILKDSDYLKGINYWSAVGGSTAIWEHDGKAKDAVIVLNRYYDPATFYGIINNELNEPILKAKVSYSGRSVFSDSRGYFEFPCVNDGNTVVKISAEGYIKNEFVVDLKDKQIDIVLIKENKDLKFRIAEIVRDILSK